MKRPDPFRFLLICRWPHHTSLWSCGDKKMGTSLPPERAQVEETCPDRRVGVGRQQGVGVGYGQGCWDVQGRGVRRLRRRPGGAVQDLGARHRGWVWGPREGGERGGRRGWSPIVEPRSGGFWNNRPGFSATTGLALSPLLYFHANVCLLSPA